MVSRSTGRKSRIKSAVAPAPSRVYQRVRVPKSRLAAFCKRHHVRSLALFGSVLRDDFRPDSDIDVLVEFDPGHTPGFLALARIESELSVLLGSHKVDVRTPQDLSRHFRDRVLSEAVALCR